MSNSVIRVGIIGADTRASWAGASHVPALAEANQHLVERVVDEWDGLDVLVNNAGTIRHGDIADLGVEDIDTVLHLNVRGTVLTTRAAIPHLSDGGRVITIGSTHGSDLPG